MSIYLIQVSLHNTGWLVILLPQPSECSGITGVHYLAQLNNFLNIIPFLRMKTQKQFTTTNQLKAPNICHSKKHTGLYIKQDYK
jgi:hypothetical protein